MRTLKKEEKEILEKMLYTSQWKNRFSIDLDNIKVQNMDDGGMGSIKFISKLKISEDKRVMKECISKNEFIDKDGILVQISLNIDNNDNLYELDFWKVNFSPINKYPKPEDLM